MPLAEFHFRSDVLEKEVSANVILPNLGTGPFATFYLLHGLSDDHTIWHRCTRIEWYVRDLPLIVVMPDGGRGFYTDNEDGPAYAKFFGEELPSIIERNFHAKQTRAGRAIGGLSMGGYGAFRIALGYPDRFISANSHSGALMAGSVARTGKQAEEFIRIFGESPAGSSHDLKHLAMLAAKKKALPKLKIDCGVDDFCLAANRSIREFFDVKKIPNVYDEFPGDHTWDYWDERIQEAIAFHAKALKLKRVK